MAGRSIPIFIALSRANKFLKHAATLAFVVKSNYDPVCGGKRRLQTQNFRRNPSFRWAFRVVLYRITNIIIMPLRKTSIVKQEYFLMSTPHSPYRGPGSVVSIVTTGWTVRKSNPGGGEIFCTCSDRPWSPHSLLYNGYRVFSGVKSGRSVTLTPHPF
jgi:hypothetical protein